MHAFEHEQITMVSDKAVRAVVAHTRALKRDFTPWLPAEGPPWLPAACK